MSYISFVLEITNTFGLLCFNSTYYLVRFNSKKGRFPKYKVYKFANFNLPNMKTNSRSYCWIHSYIWDISFQKLIVIPVIIYPLAWALFIFYFMSSLKSSTNNTPNSTLAFGLLAIILKVPKSWSLSIAAKVLKYILDSII